MTHRLFLQPSRQTPHLAPALPAARPRLPLLPCWVSSSSPGSDHSPGSPGLEQDHPVTPGSWQADRWAPGLEQNHSIPGRPRGGAALPVAPTRPTGPSGLGRRLLAAAACGVGGVGATGERSQNGTALRGWGWGQAWRPPSCCLGPPAGPRGLPGDSLAAPSLGDTPAWQGKRHSQGPGKGRAGEPLPQAVGTTGPWDS